jgi:hypothetical protein
MVTALKIINMTGNINHSNSYADKLNRRIWTTRGSRFNASRRLQNKHRLSISSISILSVYGIAIAVIQFSSRIAKCQSTNEAYTSISVILSVFTLVLSLLEGYQDYQSRAHRLHENAICLSDLLSKLEYMQCFESSSSSFPQDLKVISEKYEILIKDCPDNHGVTDFEFFQLQNRKEFNINWYLSLFLRIKLLAVDYWLYIFSVLSLPILVSFLFQAC